MQGRLSLSQEPLGSLAAAAADLLQAHGLCPLVSSPLTLNCFHSSSSSSSSSSLCEDSGAPITAFFSQGRAPLPGGERGIFLSSSVADSAAAIQSDASPAPWTALDVPSCVRHQHSNPSHRLSSLPLSSSSPCSPASPLSSSGGLPVICPCCSGRRAEREEQAHKSLSALFFCQDAEQTNDSRVGRSRTSALREAPGGESAPPPPAFEGDPERGREGERERGGGRVAWRSCGYPEEERVFFFAAHRPGSDCIVCCVWAKQRSEAKGCCCKRRNALEAVTLLDSALEEAEEQEEEEREEEDSAKGIAEATETVADQRLSERRPADSQAFSPSLPDAWCSGRAERRCTYTREAGSPEAEAGPEAERQREGERGEETEARDKRGVCSEEGRTDRRKEGRGERVADATAACSQEGSCCTHHMQEQRWSLRLDEKQREERVSALLWAPVLQNASPHLLVGFNSGRICAYSAAGEMYLSFRWLSRPVVSLVLLEPSVSLSSCPTSTDLSFSTSSSSSSSFSFVSAEPWSVSPHIGGVGREARASPSSSSERPQPRARVAAALFASCEGASVALFTAGDLRLSSLSAPRVFPPSPHADGRQQDREGERTRERRKEVERRDRAAGSSVNSTVNHILMR
uniref:Uncharacterized protein n=1 Tax=Toxoplasma gondii COUG TaxID=1074873 RepID=A0A2G8YCY5_TOXGO|nr:hypothetical protein TGCOUG_258760 [Toxoplasma gondii COUG]